ncbi:MAG: carbohydrate ABC transporter permease [Actinomycetia bacterium]|nr:carbohydrate ABC transporter permease [Actinomycetes bacterium]
MTGFRESRLARAVRLLAAGLVTTVFALPLVVIVATSFQGEGAVANYSAVLSRTPFLRYALNSLVIAVTTVAIGYGCTMLAGYALTKLGLAGRRLIYSAILVGLVLPVLTIIVPIFIVVQRLGLFSNPLAVAVPLAAVTVPFTLTLVTGYLKDLPDEILEAARVDGATSFGALVRIVIPLSGPISAVVVIWTFLQAWNEFFLPLLVMQREDSRVITQVPAFFTSQYGSDVPKIFAALVLMSLPVVAGYLVAQRAFVQGLTAGAVK